MNQRFNSMVENQLLEIKTSGLHKEEAVLLSPQGREVIIGKRSYLNFCSNNYLGFSTDKNVIATAKQALQTWGFGLSSVRFICGTQKPHKALEKAIAEFMGYPDAILYNSCFDANTGLFQSLLTHDDAVISDELNHASIIDGIRLCKAERLVYKHSDMESLEKQLVVAKEKRVRMIVTDGVFSMEGDVARMKEICNLADKYDALVCMDDSHSTGLLGKRGRGTHEHAEIGSRVDIITSTLGKALGGALGGFIVSSKPIIDLLRQRSRNYLFSNSLPPVIAVTAEGIIAHISKDNTRRKILWENVRRFRSMMKEAGFSLLPAEHPIVPIMLGDEVLTKKMSDALRKEGILVVAFSYPVVPVGQARIRVQISALHTKQDIKRAAGAFTKVAKTLGLIS